MPIEITTFPRAGLLGNPSDGYGGRVLAFTFENFSARVTLAPAPVFRLHGVEDGTAGCTEWVEQFRQAEGAEALLMAAMAAALDEWRGAADGVRPFELRWETDIPRQVGFSGSSALVIAAIRALSEWCGLAPDWLTVARLAWHAETDLLGIAAGPQDRVIQSHGGLLDMNFARGLHAEDIQPLDTALLPPLFVAWRPTPGTSSSRPHSDLRSRFDGGDPAVTQVMHQFAELAGRGAQALQDHDIKQLMDCMNRNFDLRAGFWQLSSIDQQLVQVGRDHGAGVKFAGSGGGVVGVLQDEALLPTVQQAYEASGLGFAIPRLSRMTDSK